MKRLLIMMMIFMGVLCLLYSFAQADISVSDTLKKCPTLRPGIAYNNKSYKIEYLTTAEIMNYKGVAFEGGWVADSDMAVGVVSYDLLNLKKLGVKVPILDLVDVRPGMWLGYDALQINGNLETRDRFSWGESLTLISVKY